MNCIKETLLNLLSVGMSIIRIILLLALLLLDIIMLSIRAIFWIPYKLGRYLKMQMAITLLKRLCLAPFNGIRTALQRHSIALSWQEVRVKSVLSQM